MTRAWLAAALLLCAQLGNGRAGAWVQSLGELQQGGRDLSQDRFVHRWFGRVLGGLAGQMAEHILRLEVKHGPSSEATGSADKSGEGRGDDADDLGDDGDADDDDAVPVRVQVNGARSSTASPAPPVPPAPPLAPRDASSATLARSVPANLRAAAITEHVKGASSVDLLHDIASAAGWSLTLAGVGRDKIDVDFDALAPAEALRMVLLKANCMGVLRGDKLVVIPGTNGHSAGLLIEQRGEDDAQAHRRAHHSGDVVKVGSDLVVSSGTVVQGDAVAVLGSVEVESGAVVQGTVAAIGGNVTVEPGGVVLEDSVAILGENLERGGQVLGDHVQVGLGPVFASHAPRRRGFLSRIGPFGLFPTLALFAIVYLVGLVALRLWPERMRAMGSTLLEAPLRSFVIGFLVWLLFLPLLTLLFVSVVGILLVPLLPFAVALSVMLGACALALRIGEALPAGEGQRFVPPAALGMGLTAMLLVSLVPFVGAPLLVLVLFVAPGAVVSSRFGRTLARA